MESLDGTALAALVVRILARLGVGPLFGGVAAEERHGFS
jgi:hypothetical protein